MTPKFPGKGYRVHEYVIVDTLGHGSMATVFLARDPTGHEVALKLFQEGPGVSPTLLERFKREAEASKKLRKHPNIMKVYATGKDGPYHFIVMEPIRNSRTLEDLLEVQPLTQNEIVSIVIKIARALHFAHTRSIIHRDVKPSNIMIDEFGEPLLTDFGVAALVDWPSFTMSGALTGTPLYMSPEQARTEKVGPSSDVYSLGVVLYEALTGAMPYTAQHSAPVKNVLEAVKSEIPKRPRSLRKDITPDLEAVILKALEKDPTARYPDAESFATDLERAITGRHVSAQLFSYWEHLVSWARRHDRLIAITMLTVSLLGGVVYFFRQQLLTAHYEKLLGAVQIRNFASRMLAQVDPTVVAPSQTPGAWHAIRMARRSMNAENWSNAADELQTAINFSSSAGDARTAAIAELEKARCQIMLGKIPDARETYRSILKNPDASFTVSDFAQLEALIIALIAGDKTDAVNILSSRPLPSEGVLREIIGSISGESDAKTLATRIPEIPQRLQNDARLALAVRYLLDGSERGYQSELKRSIQASSPSSEWPAPLAKALRDRPTPPIPH